MAIRKEQVLLLLTLGVGALVARSLLQEGVQASSYTPKPLAHEPAPVTETALLTGAASPFARRDVCTEPSETRPLPPRELDFPPRAPLSVAALPLDPGPDYGHLWALRLDGAVVEGVTLVAPGEAASAAANGEGGEGAAQDGPGRDPAQLAKIYDRIYEVGKKEPFWGRLETLPNQDPYELEKLRDFTGVELHFRPYSVKNNKIGGVDRYGADDRKVEKLVLAATLRNEVMRKIREVPVNAATLVERRQLVEWMIEKAREATWIYDEALKQAELYRQLSRGDLDGLRLQQRVLQARGDFDGEWALLESLTGEQRESAFRHEAIGLLKARLGLQMEAEADLRRAVELAPTDARPYASLAEFLRRSGRSREALPMAKRVEQTFGSLLDAGDRVRAVRAIVGCHLAVGNIEPATAALQLLPAELAQPYLEGCVLYASGQVMPALAKFRQAGAGVDSGASLLAQGACHLREGQWQEAHDVLQKVFDQEPLLRHRASTGLALLFVRLGQFDSAVVWIDRAIEADPQDPYAYYLRGRTLRLQGQLSAAAEALTATLRLRDDFVHAIAEMAAVQAQQALEGRGDERARAAISARRHGDRAVELVHTPAVELFELQGLQSFLAADVRAAGAAFTAARDLAPKEEEKLFSKGSLAVVDYSRGLVDDAATTLHRMTQDLAKDTPMRMWAEATLAGIDDHAQKEMLEDGFDRPEVGSVWTEEKDGSVATKADGKVLTFRGKLSRTGNGEVFVERQNAVAKGKNFLAVACTMRLGSAQPRTDGFAGLRIEMQRSGGTFDLRVQLGVREGKPFLRIEDGRSGGQDEIVTPAIEVAGFDPSGDQQLELRVVPRGDAQSKSFSLQARWNGLLVHQHDLKTLTANSSTELKTLLFAGGTKGNDIDVVFDDYRLERRKDK